MANKAAHTAFNRSVSKYLGSIGAEIKKDTPFQMDWILHTNRGELRLSVREPERMEVFSLYGKLEDGTKLNFHGYDSFELLAEIREQLEKLLIKETH